MEHISRRIQNYDMQVKAYVGELCQNLLSIPGVGYITAGLIAGEIRDVLIVSFFINLLVIINF